MKPIAPVLGVVHALAYSRDRAELFSGMVRSIRAVVPSDQLGLVIPEDEDFVHALADPPLKHSPSRRRKVDFPGTRAFDDQTIHLFKFEDMKGYPLAEEGWRYSGVQSSCVIPLVVDGRSIGLLINWSFRRETYDDLDLPLAYELGRVVAIALDRVLAYEELDRLRAQAEDDHEVLSGEWRASQAGGDLIGEEPAFVQAKRRIAMVAPTHATVLILGESGTGKDVVAHAIHDASERRGRPMVTLNCAAIPAELAESELFGHEEGSFTGAARQRRGKFEVADGSTLFLDECGELEASVQAKLLRILQERELERVGSSETIPIDVRIIAATNRDLAADVTAGRFREDLYYRLSVFPIRLPPLRERRRDIPALVRAFVARAAERLRVPVRVVSPESMERLVAYDWPGNVRELQNAVERAMIVSRGEELEIDAILPRRAPPVLAPTRTPGGEDGDPVRERYLAALDGCDWVIEGPSGAAAILGIHPNTLRYRLKRLGITRPTR
jgi:formate hydrogenlyase transcriptional activator